MGVAHVAGSIRAGPDALFGPRSVGNYIHRPELELYDMENDPEEARNLAGDDRYREVLETYVAKLRVFQKRTSDPWLLKWDYQ